MKKLNEHMLTESFRHKLALAESVGELATLIKSAHCFGLQDSFIGAIVSEQSIVGYLGQNKVGEPEFRFDKQEAQNLLSFVSPVVNIANEVVLCKNDNDVALLTECPY